jgi:hypothetical protein
MPVTRRQIMNELTLDLSNDPDVADDFADVGDQVENHWKSLARIWLTSGYATGEYENSIHRESERGRRAKGSVNAAGKKIGGQFVWHTRVVTYDKKAHLIEYGTDHDDAPNWPRPPKNGGHWYDTEGVYHWHWNTPTDAYGLAAKAELDF